MRQLFFSLTCAVLAFQGIAQKDNHSKFAIKYSPTQLIMGELHFAYEQRVARQSSIEIGLGPTVSEIGLTPVIFENMFGSYMGWGKESGLGFFGSLAFRYYPISGLATAPRGLYIGPELKYRLYNTKYVDQMYGLGERVGATTQLSFKFYTGFQFWLGNKFSMDVFTAVGVGNTSLTSHYGNVVYNQDTGMNEYFWDSNTRSRVFFTGAFGFKFGIGGTRKDQ